MSKATDLIKSYRKNDKTLKGKPLSDFDVLTLMKAYASQSPTNIEVEKAKKWDELDDAIGKFYPDDENEVEETEGVIGGLAEIGELAASKFGYLSY